MEALIFLSPRLLAPGLHVFRLFIWLVLLTLIFTPLERLFALHPKKLFREDVLTDVGYYFISSLVPSLLLAAPLALIAACVHIFIPAGFLAAVSARPLWLRLILSLIVGEIGFYWGHRWSHELPLLWRFHAIHHSAEHIDFLVNTRVHPVDMVFTRLCGLVPLYILGLASATHTGGILMPILVILIGTIWGFFIHANLRWRFGPLEWLIASPAFHHWHHTNDGPAYTDKNFSPMFPWIDYLFGTLNLPGDKHPQRYGIDQPISPILLGQLIEPFFLHKSGPPGESTDNSNGSIVKP